MAKLYPPTIAGTLPSFYTDLSGTTNIVVPFTMNQSVSRAAVKGLLLRIKRTTVDTLVGVLKTENWDDQNFTVTYTLPAGSDLVKKLVKGNYYKLQLAYYTMNNGVREDGYYSTVSIAKYTECPSVIIQGLESGVTNSVNAVQFYGQYSNLDVSEKVYQYRFIINSSKRNTLTHEIEQKTFLDTGWLIHDSSTDTELSSSVDLLTLTEMFDSSANYTMQYKIITTNGLEVASPQYGVQSAVAVGETLPILIKSELDYENGRIKITIESNGSSNEIAFSGNYYLERTDSKTSFENWLILYSFQSFGKYSEFVFYDYSIESGIAYKYGLQKISSANILSQRAVSVSPIASYFEDAFLFDGKRQLKIRYNANVSSFKEVISETKKTTLGSKYPLIFRNGNLCYKEFPITGLLTYLSDDKELFMKKSELLPIELLRTRGKELQYHNYAINGKLGQLDAWSQFIETTDQTDENVAAEKNFTMFALSWLNNGEIKLFKSPQEGNFIVKLMNVSLSPFNGTSRMIHSFSATADEIQPYTTDALLKYELLSKGTGDEEGHTYVDVVKTVDISNVRNGIMATYAYIDDADQRNNQILTALQNYDFTDGQAVSRIMIQVPTSVKAKMFSWGDSTFMMGIDGTYEMVRNEPYIGPLKLVAFTNSRQELMGATGTIYLTVRVDTSITTDNVSSQKVMTYFGWSAYGNQLASGASGQSRNIIEDFSGNKYIVSNCYKTVAHTYPEVTEPGIASQWASNYKNKYSLLYGEFVIYKTTENNATVYYRYNPSTGNLAQITPNKRIRTKNANNALIDITAYDSGSQDIVFINYLEPNEVYWTIGNDVWINFFYQVNKIDYSIETGAGINPARVEAEKKKIEWYKYTFNLTEIANKPSNANTLLFIWTGDRFSQIAVNEWFNYVTNYTIYTVADTDYSFATINGAYNNYRVAEKTLETQIKNTLIAQGGQGG